MKLLILTQYFPPETGAPQNRLFELAVKLKELGVDVTVLTAMPNYPQMEIYEAYKDKKYFYEEMSGIKVHRSGIYVSATRSIRSRLRNYFSFVVSSAKAGRGIPGNFDFLLCESPPLFLGYSAMYLARIKKAKLVFNVSDLWPESAEKLGVINNRLLLKLAYNLEQRLYRRSVLVTGQTMGICRNIGARFPDVKTYWLPNGADLNLFDPAKVQAGNWRGENGFAPNDFIFAYAGILGLAQGLEVILEAAAQFRKHKQVKFLLIGDGTEKLKLQQRKRTQQLNNVHFLPTVAKQQMPQILKNMNAVIVPLRRLELFKGAIPSKIFEALAMQLPVLLGVDGEARELFVGNGHCALYFEPGDHRQLADGISEILKDPSLALELGKKGRAYVNSQFNRANVAGDFLKRLQQL